MNRRSFCQYTLLAVAGLPVPDSVFAATNATLHKSPECGCCDNYAEYLRSNGFSVEVKATDDLDEISQKAGIPANLQGCHTMFIHGYVVDGHVPVTVIQKMLNERPSIIGIVLPGMPNGSPGMSGRKSEPFTVYAIDRNGAAVVYAVE